ncbi:MAG: KR domain-containing protein, partial [Anaerolineae bacterium]|nr:KR domain-containing protein [Anaerolineae bacterium]
GPAKITPPIKSSRLARERDGTPTVSPSAPAHSTRLDIEQTIIQIVSDCLHIKAENIDVDLPYTDLGVDSILAIDIINQINQQLTIDLRPTDLFNYADIQSLSAHIVATFPEKVTRPASRQEPVHSDYLSVGQLFEPQKIRTKALAGDSRDEREQIDPHRAVTRRDEEDIAVIGLSGRFPGAEDTATFWQNLAEGRNAISNVTDLRWSDADFYSPNRSIAGKSYSKWAGLLTEIDRFDPLFFNISPREAELMDPQQRLFLQEAWSALEDAGYAGSALAGQKCGVFVGCGEGDYQQYLASAGITEAYRFMGNSPAILAARIAYHLNLKGPSIAINTACSSSLVAIHLACESLRLGTSKIAMAGGVSILTTPNFHILASQTGMLSAQGQCRTFAQGADGFVPGEGVGVVVLKPLPQALADGDPIYGVIKGSAINQDGKTNGITAPNGPSQTALAGEVYKQFGIDPATISYVEAHGTGTALGDPIEVGALTDAFRQYTAKNGYCAMGSVKTNIGHTLAAAGVAGVIKVLLALKYKKLPPSLHFEAPNAHIDFINSPFYVNTELKDWTVEAGPRRAAVSSFGFSGTNAHLVIEAYQDAEGQRREGTGKILDSPISSAALHPNPLAQLIVLSAKNEARLRAYAEKLLVYLEQAPHSALAEQKLDDPAVQQEIQAMVADMIGVDPDNIEVEHPLIGYGLDAVQLSRLKTRLEERYHSELPLTLFSGQASVASVGQHLSAFKKEGKTESQVTLLPELPLARIAYTLQVGREAMEARLAFVVADVSTLRETLSAYLAGKAMIAHAHQGQVKQGLDSISLLDDEDSQAMIGQWLAKGKLDKLAAGWVKGLAIDWSRLYGPEKPGRISLPTYPFARERYWVPVSEHESGQHTATRLAPAAAPAVPRHMALLTKAWEPAEMLPARQMPTGRVVILATNKTQALAETLAGALPDALPLMPAQISQVISVEAMAGSDFSGCIDLTGLDASYSGEQEFVGLRWLQQLIDHSGRRALRLLHVTSRLEAYQNDHVQLGGASRAALYRLLASEYGHVRSSHVDTDLFIEDTEPLIAQILAEWHQDDKAVTICYRQGMRYQPVLEVVSEEATIKAAAQTVTHYPPEQVLWITGGTRGLGMACAQHFVKQHGVRKLVLLGQQPLPQREAWENYLSDPATDPGLKQKLEDIQALEAAGAEVRVLTGSLTDKAELQRHKEMVTQKMGSIFGVIHCAGVVSLENPAFIRKEMAEIERVAAPKVKGLDLLHEVLASEPLQFFVLFSSVSAVSPRLGVGQSDYVMANSYLDYFAGYQHSQRQHHYISLQWPRWQETGMGGVMTTETYRNSGLLSLTNEEGLTLLDAVLALKPGPVVLPVVHASSFRPTRLLRSRPEPRTITVSESRSEHGSSTLANQTVTWFKGVLSQELKLSEASLDPELPFQEYGVDSILLAQLVTRLERELPGVNLDPSVILAYPTIKGLTGYLVETYPAALEALFGKPEPSISSNGKRGVEAKAETPRPKAVAEWGQVPSPSIATVKVAVVGLACHFPDAPDIKQYWANLCTGKDSMSEVPRSRWDINHHYAAQSYQTGKSVSKWGAFLEGIEEFDPAYFGIAETLAPHIDPLARQWLEVSAEALADAGYGRRDLWGQDVGVFVGARVSNFASKLTTPPKDAIVGFGQNFIAAHLAHLYNFKGPNMVVDTACASSLTAIHLACESLKRGESKVALAGGVDILLDETPYLGLSTAQVLSPDGRCKTFDESANGIGLGEGCGVLVLKVLEQAIADRNKIYGVIEGAAINQDGATMGVTTPNPEAQQALIERALRLAQVNPRTITYVETHGTGTLIGDPIELKGLTNAFKQNVDDKQFCGVGSVKSNVGHLLSAAGAAGIIKVLLSITQRQLPPTLHCKQPNPRFNFAESPFYPVQQLTAWAGEAGIHRAGISAFGLGGHNAHLIVSDEGIPTRHRADLEPQSEPVVFNRKHYWPTAPSFLEMNNHSLEPVDDERECEQALAPFFEAAHEIIVRESML